MDTLTLINRAHQGDKLARDKILIENTGLIWSIVRRFLNRGHEGEDLFQIGEIRRFIRDDGIVKISRKIKENQMKIIHQREIYINEKKQEPTIEELEKVCDLTKEEIVMAMDASRNVESIDKEMYSKDSAYTLMDLAEDDTNIEETVLNKIMVQQLMDMLESKERKIINLRYFKNKTQSQVAKEMGMTQVQVSRLEKKILNSMRNEKST